MAEAISKLPDSATPDWLDANNPYARGAGKKLTEDIKCVPASKQDDFAQYLASSSFVHCGDAWSYLGRAVESLVHGDFHSAVHLTYYSELRAAISLLGSEGIYVGDGLNLSVFSNGTVNQISGDPTHVAAWKLLTAWSENEASTSLIANLLRPGGTPLEQWTQSISTSNVNTTIIGMLDRMSLDLQAFSNDRKRRNEASYNPTRMTVQDIDVSVITGIVSRLWEMLEPLRHSKFPVLDRIILEDILASAYCPHHPILDTDGEATESTDWTKWSQWLDTYVSTGNFDSSYIDVLKQSPPKTSLSQLALTTDNLDRPETFIQGMFVRTTVLLRLATGSCISLADESGVTAKSVSPWIESLCTSRGLWEPGLPPDDVIDLWSDLELGNSRLGSALPTSVKKLLDLLGAEIGALSQTERVLAWSFYR